VQQYIKSVKVQVDNRFDKKKEEPKKEIKKASKEEEAKQQALLSQLFKVAVSQPKIPPGADPKSVLCAFFKNGSCQKGEKCKFSHDLDIERKAAKRNIYEDARGAEEEDTMDKWDDEKLATVVDTKHKGQVTKSNKICKYFIDALKDKKYGWFWTCPNGGEACQYRHCLPKGYTLKIDAPKEVELDDVNIADQLEEERQKLRENAENLTPVTLERFLEWKKRKEEERRKKKKKRKQRSEVKTSNLEEPT